MNFIAKLIFTLVVFVIILFIFVVFVSWALVLSDPDAIEKKNFDSFVDIVKNVCENGGSESYDIVLKPGYDIVFQGNTISLVKYKSLKYKYVYALYSKYSSNFHEYDECNGICLSKDEMKKNAEKCEKSHDFIACGYLIPDYSDADTIAHQTIGCNVELRFSNPAVVYGIFGKYICEICPGIEDCSDYYYIKFEYHLNVFFYTLLELKMGR